MAAHLNREPLNVARHTVPMYPNSPHKTPDNIHTTVRELLANTSGFGGTMARHWVIEMPGPDGVVMKFLLCATDARPFRDITEIAEKACAPNSSEFQGDSLNGNGLNYQARALNDDKSGLVVASLCEDGQFAAVYAYEDYSDRTEWKMENATDWVYAGLDSKLDAISSEWYRKWNVFCLFRLPDNHGEDGKAVLPGNNMWNTAWTASEYIRSGSTPTPGRIRAYFDETIVRMGEKCQTSGGSHGQLLVQKEEFLARYQGQEFTIPTSGSALIPATGGEDDEEVHIEGRFVVRHFPVEAAITAGGWFRNLRDGKGFKKGSGSCPGKKPVRTVYGYYEHLGDERPGYSRFQTQPVFFGHDSQRYLRMMGLQEVYRKGSWFFIIEAHIDMVLTASGDVYEPMRMAKRLDRLSNQTFGNRYAFMKIMDCMANNVSPDDTAELSAYILDKYPPRESSFIRVEIPIEEGAGGTDGAGTAVQYVVYDALTGEPSDRQAESSSDVAFAIYNKQMGSWCEQVRPLPNCRSAEVFEDITDRIIKGQYGYKKLRPAYAALEKIAPEPRVFGLTIAPISTLDGDEWRPLQPDEQFVAYSPHFRPARTINMSVGENKVKVCTVVDVPAPPPGTKGGTRTGIGGGKGGRVKDRGIQPQCYRHEGFFCRMDGVRSYLELNAHNGWVACYMVPPERARKHSEEMYHYLNGIAVNLKDSTDFLRLGDNLPTAPDEEDGGTGWIDGNPLDPAINLFLTKLVRTDPYILERTKKIDAILKQEADEPDDEDQTTKNLRGVFGGKSS